MSECILIPAYNAAKTLRDVATECCELGLPVVVVNDGSRDGTRGVLEGLAVTILDHPANLGKGRALKTGFAWAASQGFDGVVTVDADGQHDVSAIPDLIRAARQTGAAITIASRFTQFEEMAGLRKFWNRFGVWCMRKRTGFEITDSQSGFRHYSVASLNRLRMDADGYNLEMEILMKVWKQGGTIASIPLAARVADGRATSHFRPVRDTWNICMTFLRHM